MEIPPPPLNQCQHDPQWSPWPPPVPHLYEPPPPPCNLLGTTPKSQTLSQPQTLLSYNLLTAPLATNTLQPLFLSNISGYLIWEPQTHNLATDQLTLPRAGSENSIRASINSLSLARFVSSISNWVSLKPLNYLLIHNTTCIFELLSAWSLLSKTH